jgi:hypothetical protein
MTKRFLPRRADLIEKECKCPFCGTKHMKKIYWTGKGVPRISCPKHAPLFRETDDGDIVYYAQEAHKRHDRKD